ncbi:hypothetical protein VTJ04DRAFT_3757 [Mycothermus thermophilus]|uniref:uncharacterized protein n=1 Tax=Humicola insolens TaxID=85995 RepID=UPI0037422DC1
MDSVARIFRRDGDYSGEKPIDNNDSVIKILVALLCVTVFGLLALGALMFIRKQRRKKQMMRETLPTYQDVKKTGNHRRLTITTSGGNGRSSVIVVNGGGQPMLANPNSPPHSPDNVPEIHITFPDEQDEQGRPKSGRVVVVRVGETSIGLEPLHDEELPAYEKESSSQFYSIDMEKIGGLKEKEYNP